MVSPIVTTHCMYFFGLSRSILSFDSSSGSGGGVSLMMTLQSLLPGLALEIMLCVNFMHNSRSLQLCSRLELHQLYRSSSKLCLATHGSKLEPKMMSCEQQSALGRETRMQT